MNITHSIIYVCNKDCYRRGQVVNLIYYRDIESFKTMCSSLFSHNQEYIYFDYENIPSAYISEQWISPGYFPLLRAVSQLEGYKQRAFSAWLDYTKPYIDEIEPVDIINTFSFCFEGSYRNPQSFTYKYAEDRLNITRRNSPKFDFDTYQNTLFSSLFLFTSEGYVFKRIHI